MNLLNENLLKQLDALEEQIEVKKETIGILERENKMLKKFIKSEMLCLTSKEIEKLARKYP